MKLISKLAAVAAVSAVAVGGGASVASAYSISGGAYSSTPSASHVFTVGSTFVYRCTSSVFSGSATGADTTAFTPAYSGCTYLGFPVFVTQSGDWSYKAIGGAAPNFSGELEIPAGSTTTLSFPIGGCTLVISGPQTFRSGLGGNVFTTVNTSTGVNLSGLANGIAYAASGCPFSSAANGTYNTNGATVIPGITIS